jgi:hypothetical protein
MPAPHFRAGAVALVVLTAALLTACSASPEAETEPPQAAPAPTATAADPTPTPTVEPASSEDPTCETLIGPSVVAEYESVGWTSQEEPFYIGSLEVVEGLQCVWADFDGPAGDHGQMFGWAELSAEEAEPAQAELVSQGWVREDGPEGIYITESPDTTIAPDEDGYGMTYLFGDGWVKLADTKQGLLLIEWPKS